MPPAPAGATTSYGPSLVPKVSVICARNYSLGGFGNDRTDSGRLVGKPEAIPPPDCGFSHPEPNSDSWRNIAIDKRGCQEHFSPSAGGAGLIRDIQPLSP